MTMTVKREEISFACPIVGPKVYIAKGPSGWAETFKRVDADRELVMFISPLEVDVLVACFVEKRSVAEEISETSWFTITGFLARMVGSTPKAVPHIVGVAFWGKIVIATTAQRAN